jgi:hypothetical protein
MRPRGFVLLIAALGMLALTGATQAATPGKLLAKYEPVTFFAGAERFRPTTVSSFVADATLERFTGSDFVVVDPDPDPDSLPSAGAGWRLNQQPCSPALGLAGEACYAASWSAHGAPVTAYGRVVRTDRRVVIQYWLFYYHNFYTYTPVPSDFISQSHEGDWEVVNVVLDADEDPLFVGYSQHCLGERRPWAKTPRWRGHHPVVFVARGSHANYFEPGVHPWDETCIPPDVVAFFNGAGLALPSDFTGDAAAAGPPSFGAEPMEIQRVTESSPAWLAFPGTWGEFQFFHAPPPIGTILFGFSPVGPALHDVWEEPLATLASWPVG